MNYINKTANPDTANAIINDFLRETQSRGNEPAYHVFTLTPLKNQLRDILIDEQQGYCCYCMRRLNKDDSTTLEHVIPKGTNETEYNSYLTRYAGFFSHIIHKNEFVRTWIYPPYPHSVAYYNLMASCKGILTQGSTSCSCCNNKRMRKEIMPLPFIPGIRSIIKYAPGGQIYAGDCDSRKDDAIKELNLNYQTLKDIRSLWYHAKKKGIKVTAKDELLAVFDGDIMNMPTHLQQYYKNDYYFTLFLNYEWFYEYYFATIKIKQVKSRIGCPKDQKKTLDALGLKKINQVVEHEATPSILGMANKVKHLVLIIEK